MIKFTYATTQNVHPRKNSIPAGKAVVGVAHASLACFLKFKDTQEITDWLSGPFYKTICIVSNQEFEKAKEAEDNIVITELTLENIETVIAFKPRAEYPKGFDFFRLYK